MNRSGFQRKKVRSKESFSARLARQRLERGLTLAGVEDELKIREHHIATMEAGHFDHLPPSHAKGFIRRYGRFLGLADEEIEAELIHLETSRDSASLFLPNRVGHQRRVIITPKTLIITLIILSVVVVLGYIGYQVRQFATPPALEIRDPHDQAVTMSDQLTITGTTDPGSTVMIDDLQANVAVDGQFSLTLTLRPGLNQITIRSVNRIKKATVKTVTVLLSLATPSPLPTVTPK